ncbi:MAG: hypothetical protein HY710_05250 [Candidatus Latescibacteria bacterium]|nr:hypothetical protein [Candidatus Latescibacterota bacterium]
MKKGLIIALAFVMAGLLGTVYTLCAQSQTIEGELIDLRCYISKGVVGEKHMKCAAACVKGGDPVGIVDAKGMVYTIGAQSAGFEALMAKMVRVTGTVKQNIIIPTKLEVKEGGGWKAAALPKEMM